MKRTRLRLATVALILTLSALPASAGEQAPRTAKVPSLLTWAWQTLARLVPALDEGRGTIDPDGGGSTPTSTSPLPEDDNDGRGTIDPNGSDPNG